MTWRPVASAALIAAACAVIGFGLGAAHFSMGDAAPDRVATKTESAAPVVDPARPAAAETAPVRAEAASAVEVRAFAAADPFAQAIGGPFRLVDQFGRDRTEADPDGLAQLVFFGFARCEAMCLMTLPDVAATVDLLAEAGHEVRPVMITIDPEGDTPETLRPAMAAFHPEMIGLTGPPDAVAAARRAFQVPAERLGETPDGVPIYAHGLYVYLLDADGGFLTLMPPILGPERMAEIVSGYLDGEGG